MSFLSQGIEAFSSQGKEMPLNLRIRKEQANSFRFWSLVRQLEDKGGSVCDNENEPKQTDEESHQKACEIINSANETMQARLDKVMMEANEIKSEMTPLPHSPQQIEK
jgi:phosphosulfolactate synthase (CoM biosynthesis protein A)